MRRFIFLKKLDLNFTDRFQKCGTYPSKLSFFSIRWYSFYPCSLTF
ncbi:hypothetical protein LEP1GSC103_1194 [Leptospira borgpetersenii serovar Javanica str. UI 09931]|uniref:Uncharacterized protein n=1 Tax=Leptospira borgpetersenii serovar Javanica str. UI 09931 TaxID=1049767 RepID=A0AAV3J706_LEPBO|nr:hypothetical protein LEP1GSC066_3740 [Leptospira sp. serovar Kenya str. Sh9]EPG56252.1 hypothetical protein LEP1GSC103_1194 [Leptospira borgpetersenii serovar Javanica str. UI 09931]